jgi:hypothetical protein
MSERRTAAELADALQGDLRTATALDRRVVIYQREAAEIVAALRDADECVAALAVYVHAHKSGNSVPPHIEAQAESFLAKHGGAS